MEELQRVIFSIGGLHFLSPHHPKSECVATLSPRPAPARTRTTPRDPTAGALRTGKRISFDPTTATRSEQEVRQQKCRASQAQREGTSVLFSPHATRALWLGQSG